MDSSQIITKNDQGLKSILESLDFMKNTLEQLSKNYRPVLKGERFLSEIEVSKILKTTCRTLLTYRTEKLMPFYQIGGKIMYKESDIQRLMEENYR